MSIAIPETVAAHPTAHESLARDLATLDAQKQAWAVLPIVKKIELLEQVKKATLDVAERWVTAAVRAKGIPDDSPLVGEEWSSGPWAVLYGLGQYLKTLDEIAKHGRGHVKKGAVRRSANGQVIVDVFPSSMYDRLLLSGVTAEVWMEPDVTPENLDEHVGVHYRQKDPVGKVALVLGAGNIASIAPLDVLYKLIAEGQVCLLNRPFAIDFKSPSH